MYTYITMSSKIVAIFGSTVAAFSLCAVTPVRADEKADAADDAALRNEIRYVEALIDCGFPDFAEPVIAATKKKWPESETAFFAIEIRGMLSLGKFEEAEKKVAALPDRKGSKYWAARLEIANNYFARGNKPECSKIYAEFFKAFSGPIPKDLREFYLQASYAWGQIQIGDRNFKGATETYEGLLKQLNKNNDDDMNIWCNVACETAEMYLQLASAEKEKSPARNKYVDAAQKLVDQLLWEQGRPVYFGRAIAMKANIELLRGSVEKAQATIDDYMPQLTELHQTILQYDPDGRQGLLKQSPMPLCRYMLADILWKEAQAEYKKAKRNDDLVKDLLFGAKVKGKRNGNGAFNHSLNVFIKYPESTWAVQAGELSEAVRTFAEDKYGAKIKTQVTPEQIAKVRQMQFRAAHESFAEGQYKDAIKGYTEALTRYPEGRESILAIENLAKCYLNIIQGKEDSEEKNQEHRLDADAVEGYLAERFAGAQDRALMTDAGDAVMRLAALEKEYKNEARAKELQKMFLKNYDRHVNVPGITAAMAGEAQKAENYLEAMELWRIIIERYKKSPYYGTALWNLATCHEKSGNRPAAIKAMKKYCEVEEAPLKQMGVKMQIAKLYQIDGLEIFKSAETNETPEAVDAQLKKGSAQIIRGIKEFSDFAKQANEALAQPNISPGEKKQYQNYKEAALYLVGDCWSRLTKPEEKLDEFRKRAIDSFEEYVKQCPTGQYAKFAYLQLATLHTALGNGDGSKSALERLSEHFPDSQEAKDAMPRLAKSLVEMGKTKEGTEIYAEMLRTKDGRYTAHQFVNAGEALIIAKDWSLADQAFNKAIQLAGTNSLTTVARARLGQANALFKQKAYDEARNQIDLFLEDDKMKRLAIAADANMLMVEVASEQGRTEKNDALRQQHFNAAVGAVRKLRDYRRNKPVHEQDEVDLMSADIMIKRMEAEDAMDLAEQAQDTCRTAATMLQTFLQGHEPNEAYPFEKFSAGEQANLERAYATIVPLFSRLGDEQADRVVRYADAYLKYFPNGSHRTEIVNCLNKAKSAAAAMEKEETTSETPSEGETTNEE